MSVVEVVPVPALRDNYAYLLCDRARGRAVVIDPSESAPVKDVLRREGLELEAIWCTHHHPDHVGGVPELLASRKVEVVGSEYDRAHGRIEGQSRGVADGERLAFGETTFEVWSIPGHTLGAIAFVSSDRAHVFTGDTLFLAGCGRVFEGTMPMMRASLEKLRALPDSTRVWCGHEYTDANLRFARHVEPGNDALAERAAGPQRASSVSVPGRMDEERATNPFLRWDAPEVVRFAGTRDPDEVFACLRQAKDRF
jgi:hydroxyacylglutathione hydrolase